MNEKYKIFCLSFDNKERKKTMENKFKQLKIDYLLYNGVDFKDQRIHPDSYKKCWSCMYGHLDMIRMFYEDTNLDYGIFCEDDIYIHKDFKDIIPLVIQDFKNMKLDVLLLGYLVTFKIESYYNGFELKYNDNNYNLENYKYHEFTNDIWGTQMYMLSKDNAKQLLDKYDENSNYAIKSLNDETMTPFSADWTITKDGNRALISPCLAVEDGKGELMTHFGGCFDQYNFHKNCHKAHYNKDIFI